MRCRVPRGILAITCALSVLAVSCTGSGGEDRSGRLVVRHAAFPVALTSNGDGGLLYAERLTGRVRRVDHDRRLEMQPVARIDVSTAGQRGLLGLTTDRTDRIFAAFTSGEPGRPITVAQLVPTFRLVWSGPPSAKLANGGHLVYDASRDQLIIGIGDLGQRAKRSDPEAPNGKLLLLDPAGAPTQRPTVLSQGWNNPFAFALTPAGALWVADNVPGQRGERLARGDLDGQPTHITRLPTNTVPAGLAAQSDDTLIVCSFARRRTLRYQVQRGRAVPETGFGSDIPCRTGIAPTYGERGLWLADERSIHQLSAVN